MGQDFVGRDSVGQRARCLVLNGTVGVGKTTTADVIGDRWRDAGVPGAVIDVDRLRWCWPAPPDDPHNGRLGLENLALVAANYVRHGARRLVLADVIEDASGRRRQAETLGLPVTVIRLIADPDLIETRLRERHRHDADPADLAWHLHRIRELAAIQESAAADDAVIDITGLAPDEVVDAVLAATGWDEG